MIEFVAAIVIAMIGGFAYLGKDEKTKDTDTIICVGICQHSTTRATVPVDEPPLVYPDGDAPAPANEP